MTVLHWLYAGGLLVALAAVIARVFSRSPGVKPVERAADCAALSILMVLSKHFGWTWLAFAGAALGAASVVAMFYFYFRRPPRA